MPVQKATKKPVTIEYLEFVGVEETGAEVEEFLGDDFISLLPSTNQVVIKTLEGEITGSAGDLIIRGVKGEHYPCKPDVFEQTYGEPEKPWMWRLVKWDGESAATLELADEFADWSNAQVTALTQRIGGGLMQIGARLAQSRVGDYEDDDYFDEED